MSQAFLPFSRPSIGDEEIAAVEQVLRSGWITTGPKNQALEEQFAQYVGCRYAVALSSATGGMHIARFIRRRVGRQPDERWRYRAASGKGSHRGRAQGA